MTDHRSLFSASGSPPARSSRKRKPVASQSDSTDASPAPADLPPPQQSDPPGLEESGSLEIAQLQGELQALQVRHQQDQQHIETLQHQLSSSEQARADLQNQLQQTVAHRDELEKALKTMQALAETRAQELQRLHTQPTEQPPPTAHQPKRQPKPLGIHRPIGPQPGGGDMPAFLLD
ncbi:MAG: hypothetical protein NW237_07065 [Cyanobacteriota bacterium]|nr:hypothetical protein [Cyanobacteriota bacterium]